METLVLNAYTTPVSIVPIKRAISLVVTDRALVLQSYPDIIVKSNRIEMALPSVIQCTDTDYIPKKYVNVLPFTRKNVYIRDQGRCQYCGKKVGLNSFSFDHVNPRCKGGLTCWENIVICCMKCNSEKGCKPLNRYKRALLRKPYAPRLDRAAPAHLVNRVATEIPHQSWRDYIYWNVILLP